MTIKTRKIGIIGAGNVGSHLALQFAVQGLADEVVFYDINNDKAHGESLDLLDAVSYQPHHFEAYAGTVADMKDADILINASGTPRLPGQTRLDMMDSAVATSKEFIPRLGNGSRLCPAADAAVYPAESKPPLPHRLSLR